MKYFLLALICLGCITKSLGQVGNSRSNRVDVEITKEKRSKRITSKVQMKWALPDGDSSWAQTIEKKLNDSFRVDRRVKKGTYLVVVTFLVMKDSSIAEVKCVANPGFGMGEEVTRLIKRGPKWSFRPRPVMPYHRTSIIYQDSN